MFWASLSSAVTGGSAIAALVAPGLWALCVPLAGTLAAGVAGLVMHADDDRSILRLRAGHDHRGRLVAEQPDMPMPPAPARRALPAGDFVFDQDAA